MSAMTPYYDEAGITIYHADCRDVLAWCEADVLLTDPPYGLEYTSGWVNSLKGIQGDSDTSLRDWVHVTWGNVRPWAMFGTWKRPKPIYTPRGVLVWEKGDHVGMGDLSLPWSPNWEEIYVGGGGWTGHRGSSVLSVAAPVSWNTHSNVPRRHPHEKPTSLLTRILDKAPSGVVADPFMGSGTTLRAARDAGRHAIGIEIEEQFCEIAVQRLAQGVLEFQ